MIVAVLVRDPTGAARVQEALRGMAHVRMCERDEELLTLVANGLASVVVVDLRDRAGTPTIGVVRHIRELYPSVPVIAYCALTPDSSRDILELARAGVNDLVLRGVDDVGVPLRAAISSAQDHCGAKEVLAALGPLLPPSVVPFIRYCLENGRRALTVPEVARALGVHRKTLVERHSAAGLPSPSAMIQWCRLLVAARLLEDPGRAVEHVALLLDFPSGTSLRNMLKRYTGLRPGEIRENGGMRCVLHIFRQSLRPVVRRMV
jgi:AraC-like DNA-binding protein